MGCKGGTERPLDHIEQPTRIALNLLTALVMTVSPHSLHVGHSPTAAHSVGTSKSVFLLFILLYNASLIIMGFETMNIINVSLITFPLARARVRLHLISPRGRGIGLGGLCSIYYPLCYSNMLKIVPIMPKIMPQICLLCSNYAHYF